MVDARIQVTQGPGFEIVDLTDGTTAVTLNADSWNNLPMGCGLEEFLLEKISDL